MPLPEHYKLMYPTEYVAACDLAGKDATVTIDKIEIEDVVGQDGKKQRKPVLTFKNGKKRMVCCKTNAGSIARDHGNNPLDWVGKKITIYPTTCQAFGQERECIRVR